MAVPRNNEEGSVSGFGIAMNMAKPLPNNELKTTYLTVVRDAECPIRNFQALVSSNFCARDFAMNSRLCKGDTGSAFVILQRGTPVLVSLFIVLYVLVCAYANTLVPFSLLLSLMLLIYSFFFSLSSLLSSPSTFANNCYYFCCFIIGFCSPSRLVSHHKSLRIVPLMKSTMLHHFYASIPIWDGSKL